MTEYLEEYENSLDKDLCDYIIQNFLEEKNKHDGITSGGINKDVNNTNFEIKLNDVSNLNTEMIDGVFENKVLLK